MEKTVWLRVSSAFLVGGKIARAGDIVEVEESVARSLLHRGKASLATMPQEKKIEPEPEPPEARIELVEVVAKPKKRRGKRGK